MKIENEMLEVVSVVEHEDGGATFTFDMTEKMSDLCGALGLKLLIFCGALNRSPDFVFNALRDMIEETYPKGEKNENEDDTN